MKAKFFKEITLGLLLLIPAFGYGQTAPNLNSAGNFGILAGTAINFNGPTTVVDGMLVGLHPGNLSSITGNYSVINGEIYAADYDPQILLVAAKQDLSDAYDDAAGQASTDPIIAGDQGGKTLAPGVYKSISSLSIALGNLTLDAQGNVDAIWIFQIASDFTTIGGGPFPSPSGGNVILAGGARAENVFWQVGSSATIGDYTDFKGTILALTSISVNSGAQIEGRLLAQNGAVTFAGGSVLNRPDAAQYEPGDLTITKTASPLQGYAALGDVINYEIVVVNNSEATVDNISVSDPTATSISGSPIASLAAGASASVYATHTITAEDLNNGFVINIATASAGAVEVSDYEFVSFEQAPFPLVSLATWSIVLGVMLIAGFGFFRYLRFMFHRAEN